MPRYPQGALTTFPPIILIGTNSPTSKEATVPPTNCTFQDQQISCPAKLEKFLIESFGKDVAKSDVSVSNSSSSELAPEKTFQSPAALRIENVAANKVGKIMQHFETLHMDNELIAIVGGLLVVPLVLHGVGFRCSVVVFVMYCSLYTAWAMLTFAKGSGSHGSGILVLGANVVKVFLSFCLWWGLEKNSSVHCSIWSARRNLFQYIVPAGLYAAGDIMRVDSVRHLGPSTFAVLFNSRMLFLALGWQGFMNRKLDVTRWISLTLIFVGGVLKVVPFAFSTSGFSDPLLSEHYQCCLFRVVGCAVCSACAGLCNERVMRNQPEVGFMLQNLAMHAWSAGWSVLMCTVLAALFPANHISPFEAEAWTSLFADYLVISQMVLLALLGVVTGFFLKYLSSIAREVALGVFVISTMLVDTSVFKMPCGGVEIGAACLVFIGVVTFARSPMLESVTQDASEQTISIEKKPRIATTWWNRLDGVLRS